MAKGKIERAGVVAASIVAGLGACTGGGGGGGNGGGGGGGGDAGAGGGGPIIVSTPNPYADGGDPEPTQLGQLTVFGDSYSVISSARPGVNTWAYRLDRTSGGTLNIYARSGASASDPNPNPPPSVNDTLAKQVDNWVSDLGDGSADPQEGNDLAVVYLGHNDVSDGSDLDNSLSEYEEQVDRLLDLGVGDGDRKLFVTLIHDFSQVPQQRIAVAAGAPSIQPNVNEYNDGIVDIANARDDLVVVDLRTVFDRVNDDPGAYGFTNVTTADSANADTTALYFDDEHFGNRGQDIIDQVFEYYLTRGWDFANSLEAGEEATEYLQDEIDDEVVFSLNRDQSQDQLGFSTFLLGDDRNALAASDEGGDPIDPTRAAFAQLQESEEGDSGAGVSYALSSDTLVGVAMSRFKESRRDERSLTTSEADVASDAVTLYANQELGGLNFRTLLTHSDDQHRRNDFDALVGSGDDAEFGGTTTALRHTVSDTWRAGPGWLSPWAGLTHRRQAIDGYTQSNLYLGDVKYSGAEVNDTLASVGLSGELDPVALGKGNWMWLTAGVSWTRGLIEDDYEVRMTDTGSGFKEDQTIEREATNLVGLDLGAKVSLGDSLSLNAGYEIGQQLDGETSHLANVRVRYGF